MSTPKPEGAPIRDCPDCGQEIHAPAAIAGKASIGLQREWAEKFLFPNVHPSGYSFYMESCVRELADKLAAAPEINALTAAPAQRDAGEKVMELSAQFIAQRFDTAESEAVALTKRQVQALLIEFLEVASGKHN